MGLKETMNLQSYSFGVLYKNLSVTEVQRQCRELRGADDICENPNNWRSYVQEKYGRKYLAERGDLITAEDWIDFARGMQKGYTFHYTTYIPIQATMGKLIEGTHNYSNTILGEDPYFQPIDFKLRGTFIRSGPTIHYIVSIGVSSDVVLQDPAGIIPFKLRLFSSSSLMAEYIDEYLNTTVFDKYPIENNRPIRIEISRDAQFTPDDEEMPFTTVVVDDPLLTIRTLVIDNSSYSYYLRLFVDGNDQEGIQIEWYPVVKVDI